MFGTTLKQVYVASTKLVKIWFQKKINYSWNFKLVNEIGIYIIKSSFISIEIYLKHIKFYTK